MSEHTNSGRTFADDPDATGFRATEHSSAVLAVADHSLSVLHIAPDPNQRVGPPNHADAVLAVTEHAWLLCFASPEDTDRSLGSRRERLRSHPTADDAGIRHGVSTNAEAAGRFSDQAGARNPPATPCSA